MYFTFLEISKPPLFGLHRSSAWLLFKGAEFLSENCVFIAYIGIWPLAHARECIYPWSCLQCCFWFCFQCHDWYGFQCWKGSVSMGSMDSMEPINTKNLVLGSIDFQKSVKRDFQYFHVISKIKNFGTLLLATPKVLMLCGPFFLLCCV